MASPVTFLFDRFASTPLGSQLRGFRDRINRRPPSRAQRIAIYEFLADLLANDISVVDALSDLYVIESKEGRDPEKNTALLCRDWIRDARVKPLAEAFGDSIPAEERMILAAGETSQRLVPMLHRLKRFLDLESAGRTGAIGKLAYPLLVVGTTVAVAIFTHYPALEQLAQNFPIAKWAPLARSFWYVSLIATYAVIPVLLGILGGVAGYIYLCPRWTSELRARLDRYPPFSLYRDRVGARFLATLSAMKFAARLTDRDIFDNLINLANPWLRQRLRAARFHVAEGRDIGQAFRLAALNFPDDRAILEIGRYSTLPSLPEKLERLAESTQRRAALNFDRFTTRVAIAATVWIIGATIYLLASLVSLGFSIAESANL